MTDSGAPWADPKTRNSPMSMGQTARERAAAEIRSRILLGTLRVGDTINLDTLSDEFGVSRTPIREACLRLADEGLLRMAPRSGITVIGVDDRDLLDNFELMASLSGMAAGWAAERATEAETEQITTLQRSVVKASEEGGDVAQANFEFHRCINQSSHSPRVMTLIGRTALLFPERFSDVIPEQVPCSLREHEEIVQAITDRDPGRARAVMEHHFLHAAVRLREFLDAGGTAARAHGGA